MDNCSRNANTSNADSNRNETPNSNVGKEEKADESVDFLDYQKMLSLFNLQDDNVALAYQFGSRVYGTSKPNSDYDIVVVLKDYTGTTFISITEPLSVDAIIYNTAAFQTLMQNHYIFGLLHMWLPPRFVWKDSLNYKAHFRINIEYLRSCCSREASRTWVKGKKKMESNDQPLVGKKNVVNAIREIQFGIQIAQHGKIIDWTICNDIAIEIRGFDSTDFKFYSEKYKKKYKTLCTDFRAVAPAKSSPDIVPLNKIENK